jgi:GH24 family phage-related lysozyme (muramidase)
MDLRLISDVSAAEGRKLFAYRDTLGNWTAGVGHLLQPQSKDWTGFVITPAQSNSWLADDLATKQSECEGLLEWKSLNTPCRQNAMIECVFNLGVGHWTAEFPKTRASLLAQDWPAASDHLLASPKWIAQVGEGRVQRLANYFFYGVYPQSI